LVTTRELYTFRFDSKVLIPISPPVFCAGQSGFAVKVGFRPISPVVAEPHHVMRSQPNYRAIPLDILVWIRNGVCTSFFDIRYLISA
jgi:hypothetical protein